MYHSPTSFGHGHVRDSISSHYRERQWYEARQRYQIERARVGVATYLLVGSVVTFALVCVYLVKVLGL